ncbi:MAG: YwiC-like family protein [Burkholderiales bacterium]|nr:YwiC-like family protein [Burkholderiales bacterium]
MSARLWPREHGAYAELLFPIASGLALGRPVLAALAFGVAAFLAFLAGEPLLVARGVRGGRLRDELGAAARRRFAALAAAATASGIVALASAPAEARVAALVPVAAAALLVPLALARRLKTLGGELLAAAAFASLHLPVGAASGLSGTALWGPCVVWLASFTAGTFAVHAIKARQQRRDPGLVRAAIGAAALTVAGSAAVAVAVPEWRWLGAAALVPCLGILGVNFLPIRTKSLMTLGWSLVAANAVALAILVAAG